MRAALLLGCWAFALLTGAATPGFAVEDDVDELRARVEELESRVDELEAAPRPSWWPAMPAVRPFPRAALPPIGGLKIDPRAFEKEGEAARDLIGGPRLVRPLDDLGVPPAPPLPPYPVAPRAGGFLTDGPLLQSERETLDDIRRRGR